MAEPLKTKRKNGFNIRKESTTIIMIVAALFVLNILFFIFFTRPAISSYRFLNAGNNPTIVKLEQKRKDVNELEERLKRIEDSEKHITEMYKNVFGTKEQKMIDIQLEVVSIANEFGIDPASVAYENSEMTKEEVERFTISIPLTGTYANLRQFINKIENSKNFLIIDRIFLRAGKEGGITLQLNIQLSTFFNAPYLAEMQRMKRRRI